MNKKAKHKNDYGKMERKLFFRFSIRLLLILFALYLFYRLAWLGRGGEMLISFLENTLWMEHESAFNLYHYTLRNNAPFIVAVILLAAFLVMYR